MTLGEAFLEQAAANRDLGSPFTARVLGALATRMEPGNPVIDRMQAWQGDVSHRGASLPLRLLGGLHALVLTGTCPELAACYPPNPRPSDADLAVALDTALERHTDMLMRWLDNPPQTNEVRRAAVIIATAQWLSNRFGLNRFVTSELGASAGLNLMWDRFRLALACGTFGPKGALVRLDPEWRGPCPPAGEIAVTDRRGVDLSPLDPHDEADALRLLSYVWADQRRRIARARAAISLAEAPVDKGDAGAWLKARLAQPHPGAIHLVTHSIAWQYFPAETRETCLDAFAEAGARATPEAPLARLSMEADGRTDKGAPLSLTVWPGGEVIDLGRADFHGRWVDWKAPQSKA